MKDLLATLLLGVLCVLHLSSTPSLFPFADLAQREHIVAVNRYLAHPHVALPPTDLTLAADPENAVQLQDLRGVECYAQPDQLNVCGSGDTIPILLFTKSEDPIFDITLSINFDEGLEYGRFAYVHSGPADLDTINVDNPEAPVFRISELSQAGGAIVVYVGVRAGCGLNLAINNPSVTFGLDYVAGGVACEEEISPETPYGSNVAVPEVVFAATSFSVNPVEVSDYTTDACTTIPLTQVTMGAGALGALLTIDDYGFEIGNTVSSLSVDGVTVPAEDITIDDMTGMLTANLDGVNNTGYFGGDGVLDFAEQSVVEICFQSTDCYDSYEPTLSVVFACEGELCAGSPDFEESLVVENTFNFDVAWTSSTPQILQEPSVCGVSGAPENLIIQWTLSNTVLDSTADIRNLFIYTESCPILEPDTVYLGTGGLPASEFIRTNAGRYQINLNDLEALTTDPDGPGGLDDVDGDGYFDDLPGEESLLITIELSPSAGQGDDLSCASDDFLCEFTRVQVNYNRDCGRERRGATGFFDTNPSYANTSTASIGGDTTSRVVSSSQTDRGVFDFMQFGYTSANPNPNDGSMPPPTTQTRTVEFTFNLGDMDFGECGVLDNRYLLVQYNSFNGLPEDIVMSNVTYSGGGTQTFTRNVLSQNLVEFIIEDAVAEGASPGVDYTYSFDMTLDSNSCAPYTSGDLSIYLVDECGGCTDATSVRVCDNVRVWADPDDNPNCICDAYAFVSLERCSRGYTDPTLSTRLPESDILDRGIDNDPEDIGTSNPDIDTLNILPGDTIEATVKYVIRNPGAWNNLDYIDFQLIQLNENLGNTRLSMNSMLEIHLASVQSFTFNRGATTIDLGAAVNPAGDNSTTSGINIGAGSSFANPIPGPPQPAFPHGNYRFSANNSGADVSNDAGRLRLNIANARVGNDDEQLALDALYNAIGGNFELSDTVTIVWKVPIIRIPETLANGEMLLGVDSLGVISTNISFRQNTPTGGLGPSNGGVTTTCRNYPAYILHDPEPVLNSTLEFSADGCDVNLVLDFTVDRLPPDGWYPNEYRPLIGLEDFSAELPASFYHQLNSASAEIIHDGASYQLTNFSLAEEMGLDSLSYAGNDYVLAHPARGTFTFIDSEKADETEWNDYEDDNMDGSLDVFSSGADLPRIGVGLGQQDTLRITIPLERFCSDGLDYQNLMTDFNASYPYLPDYNVRAFICNDGTWYMANECPAGVDNNYWPYDRLDDDNAHRFSGSALSVSNTPPPLYTVASTMVTTSLLVDGMGTETNTYTMTVGGSDIPGGILAIEVANAVDLQSISGDATTFTEATTTDSSVIYAVEIPATLAGGTFSIDLTTDLIYCDQAFVCLTPLVGCTDEPEEIAALIVDSGVECTDGTSICYEYIAGLANVVTTFDYPAQQNGCLEQTYNIQFRNRGTSDLMAFFPTVFVPEGLAIVGGSWMVQTFSPNEGPTSIVDPVENTDKTGVYGIAYEWGDTYFNGIAGTDLVEEGEIVVISFRAQPTCDFISGLPIAGELNASAACDREYETPPTAGPPVHIVDISAAPAFEFSVTENRISCSEGTAPITLTATNTGKTGADETEICILLPPGIMLTADDVEAIAPAGYDPIISDPVAVGTGGATEVCISGPEGGIEPGGFLCLNILPQVGAIDCGPADIGFRLMRTTTIDCAGMTCDIQALTSESLIPIEVVPGAAIGEASLTASCSATPGSTDLNVSLDVENLGDTYADDITLELYFDIDGSGEVEDADPLLGMEVQAVTIASGATETIMATFTVPEDQACPVIVKAIVPGCDCGEVFIPFDPVEPDFIADIGTNFVLCPGDSAVIEGICGTFDLVLEPMAAGNAYQTNDSIIVSLNDGFGVDAPVTLTATNSIGNCGMQEFEVLFTQLETFEFGPYNFEVCTEGCQILDLDIPIELQEDLEINISPSTFLSDATSFEPEICDPTSNTTYTIDFMLNGECMTSAAMNVTVVEPPSVELTTTTGCSSGFRVADIVSVTPVDLDGIITSDGDGTFDPTTAPTPISPDLMAPAARLSDGATYIPGPEDLAAGEVTITVRTVNPDGPCGGVVARETFTILLVDCGSFPWGGN